MVPKQIQIEIPLLKSVEEMGGKGKPRDIYSRVRKFFPDLTEDDLTETHSSGSNKWTNRIQWVRQALIDRGEMESLGYGVWGITEKGRNRLRAEGSAAHQSKRGRESAAKATFPPSLPNLEEVADDYLSAYKKKVVQKLQDLTPQQFERFAVSLLSAYGFVEMRVTGKGADGGIDGHGKLRVGLALMNVAFQCKRWQGQVGRPEIDKFRGAIQGEFEQGILLTTSDFSTPAREASIKRGAAPIVLLNGETVAQLMIDKELGVRRRPIEIYEDRLDALFENANDYE